MIVDVHRHMWSVLERHYDTFSGMDIPGRVKAERPDFDWEQTTREIVEEMDEAGVDKTVMFVADFAARLGDPPFPINQENRLIVNAHELFPDRIVPFYGIDPRRPGAADLFEKAIKEWNVRGIKLHPSVGYLPHERTCYAIYELCTAFDVPVIFHAGPCSYPHLYSRYTRPIDFDEVATDFPNMGMIIAHAAGDWWQEALTVFYGRPNVVMDLSAWQLRIRDNPEVSLRALGKMRDTVGIQRLLFGTDFPVFRPMLSLKETVGMFRDLPALGAEYGVDFDEAEVDGLLGSNAERFLRLSS